MTEKAWNINTAFGRRTENKRTRIVATYILDIDVSVSGYSK